MSAGRVILSMDEWRLIASAVQAMRGRAGLPADDRRALDGLAARIATTCPLCGGEHRVDKCARVEGGDTLVLVVDEVEL